MTVNDTFKELGWTLTDVVLSEDTTHDVDGALVYTFRNDVESFNAAFDGERYILADFHDPLDERLVSDFDMSDEDAERFVDTLVTLDQTITKQLRTEATRIAHSL